MYQKAAIPHFFAFPLSFFPSTAPVYRFHAVNNCRHSFVESKRTRDRGFLTPLAAGTGSKSLLGRTVRAGKWRSVFNRYLLVLVLCRANVHLSETMFPYALKKGRFPTFLKNGRFPTFSICFEEGAMFQNFCPQTPSLLSFLLHVILSIAL